MTEMKIDNYVLKTLIGKGGFGEVYLTIKEGTGQVFATKRMNKKKSESILKNLNNEISILKKLNHRNIVHLEDYKTTTNNYYIIFEYCNGGSLADCLKKFLAKYSKPFPEEIVQYLMSQIISAIQYLHNQRIIHRDLKLENILVKFPSEADKNSLNMFKAEIKIIDFDFARYLSKGEFAHTALGSPVNMDPKILKSIENDIPTEGYDESADIWSIGILCYEMLIGRPPFESNTVSGILKNVEKGNYSIPLNLSKEVVSFLNGMIQNNPIKRLSANELIRHYFIIKNIKEFTPIKLKGNEVIKGGKMVVNSKEGKEACWGDYDDNDAVTLRNIPADLIMPPNANQVNKVQNYFEPYNIQLNQLPIIPEENYNYKVGNPTGLRPHQINQINSPPTVNQIKSSPTVNQVHYQQVNQPIVYGQVLAPGQAHRK